MQDIVLEPYGAEVLGLSVSETTSLTVLLAGGALAAYALAARMLAAGLDPYRLAGYGALTGLPAFALVIASGPLNAPILFGSGVALVGFGGGLFSVATLVAAMGLEEKGSHGLALGAWGAAHATAAGLAMSCGGLIRDGVGSLAQSGALGQVLNNTWAGYSAVYHIEVALLFATLIAIGPLARLARRDRSQAGLGLAEIPR
jgi:BCD family chlorophyll transporter-like MFS transporter